MKEVRNDIVLRLMEDYVIQPRKYNREVLEGRMTREEYTLNSWIRGSCNPYAKATVTLGGLHLDIFGGRYTNTSYS